MAAKVKVLFVCAGNLCRSPMSQGAFEKGVREAGLADQIIVDSAGTHTYYVKSPPDNRAQEVAQQRGYDLSRQRARRVTASDFNEFDYIVAMDDSNFAHLMSICPPDLQHKLSLFMNFSSTRSGSEIPDPYYGDRKGFERVLNLVEQAAAGLLRSIRRRHRL
jgi:protein-tyrosine phosphatase